MNIISAFHTTSSFSVSFFAFFFRILDILFFSSSSEIASKVQKFPTFPARLCHTDPFFIFVIIFGIFTHPPSGRNYWRVSIQGSVHYLDKCISLPFIPSFYIYINIVPEISVFFCENLVLKFYNSPWTLMTACDGCEWYMCHS